MVLAAGLVAAIVYGLCFTGVWFAWRKTAGRPVLRTIAVGLTGVVSLIVITLSNEVIRELAKRSVSN